jgi:mannose-1-phosphate guanylyltransferase/mannose-6-phosphate isomerase
MSKINLLPVILCGGSGTRLWPLSREGFPKQFLALNGSQTLFQQALLRTNGVANSEIIIEQNVVVTNEHHRFLALDQYQEISQALIGIQAQFLLEPTGKNTAPALTLASLIALSNSLKSQIDPILLVTPADHTIENQTAFSIAIQKALFKAQQGVIVVVGISPSHAETGYGYIQQEGELDVFGTLKVKHFIEKPNATRAKEYLTSGDYFWNGGIFVLKASLWLKAIQTFRPDIWSACNRAYVARTMDHAASGAIFLRPNPENFRQIPAESIDYAVIEKCPNSQIPMAMVPLDAGWSDLGAWDAVWKVGQADEAGNVKCGDTILHQTTNSLIYATHRLVGLVGVQDLVVVETADAVLISDRKKSQEVKSIVQQLQAQKREEKNLHRKVNRPWGWYDSIDEGERFKVKRIQVKPGASLSLQMHYHRAEHWIVVKGIAEVTNGDQVLTLHENQSTFIPQGQTHRLSNPGTETLEIIEVQSGAYLGEDDIVRFEDSYGRA